LWNSFYLDFDDLLIVLIGNLVHQFEYSTTKDKYSFMKSLHFCLTFAEFNLVDNLDMEQRIQEIKRCEMSKRDKKREEDERGDQDEVIKEKEYYFFPKPKLEKIVDMKSDENKLRVRLYEKLILLRLGDDQFSFNGQCENVGENQVNQCEMRESPYQMCSTIESNITQLDLSRSSQDPTDILHHYMNLSSIQRLKNPDNLDGGEDLIQFPISWSMYKIPIWRGYLKILTIIVSLTFVIFWIFLMTERVVAPFSRMIKTISQYS